MILVNVRLAYIDFWVPEIIITFVEKYLKRLQIIKYWRRINTIQF